MKPTRTQSTLLRIWHVFYRVLLAFTLDTFIRYWPFTIQTSMSWNIICFCTTFFFFCLYLMGHILILLRSACLCAVLIFSSSLMHCCIIYIPQYNKPPPPALTQSHISPRAIPLGGIGRIDHIAGAVDLWEMGRHCGCHILIPPPWLRPFDAWRGSTRLTYSKSSTLVHTLLLSPLFSSLGEGKQV